MRGEAGVNQTRKITTLGILGALGAVLMTQVQIPYPPVPFLKIEFSDIVVLIAFLLYGWKEAAFLGVLKAVINAMVWGLVGPFGIGQISAFIASMSYVLGMYLAVKIHLNNRHLLTAMLTVSIVVVMMVFANFLFVTPLYLGFSLSEALKTITPRSVGINIDGGYLTMLVVAYVPFNLIKGALVMFMFYIVNRALTDYMGMQSTDISEG